MIFADKCPNFMSGVFSGNCNFVKFFLTALAGTVELIVTLHGNSGVTLILWILWIRRNNLQHWSWVESRTEYLFQSSNELEIPKLFEWRLLYNKPWVIGDIWQMRIKMNIDLDSNISLLWLIIAFGAVWRCCDAMSGPSVTLVTLMAGLDQVGTGPVWHRCHAVTRPHDTDTGLVAITLLPLCLAMDAGCCGRYTADTRIHSFKLPVWKSNI